MGLSDGGQNFPGSQIDILLIHISRSDNLIHAGKVVPGLSDAPLDKLVCLSLVEFDVLKTAIDVHQLDTQFIECLFVLLILQKTGIDTRLTCFFVFQQPVGHIVVG